MRVASLTPSNTETVAFLGLEDDLVAVDSFSDWPPRVEGCIDVGPDLHIDVDRLEQADPDLVLSSTTVPGMEEVVSRVREAGLDQLVTRPRSLAGIEDSVRDVAKALEVTERGRRLAEAMRTERERLEEVTTTGAPGRPRVHWEWWPDPVIVAGGKGWMPGVLHAAGAENAFGHVDEESPEVTLAQVHEIEPEVIALCWQGTLQRVQDADRVRGREGFDELAAVRQGRIVETREELYGRPGPRIVEGIRSLAARLHPGLEARLGEPFAWVPQDLRPSALDEESGKYKREAEGHGSDEPYRDRDRGRG